MFATSSNADRWHGLRHATKAIVVVDVAQSVQLMQRDEAGFIDRWRRFVAAVDGHVLPAHGGRLVKSLGDGLLLEFEHVQPAIAAALQMHGLARMSPAPAPANDDAMHLRIGCHVAPIAFDGLDVYGTGVNLASRFAALAQPGETVVSTDVRGQLADGVDADLEDLGECYLKHIEEPVRAYRVHSPGASPRPALLGGRQSLQPGIAVIPFAGGPPTTLQAYVGEALADEIISHLSTQPGLLVLSRLSTSALRERADLLVRARTQLHADYVLSGSVHSDGAKARLRVALAEAGNGETIWTGSVAGDLAELLIGDGSTVRELVQQACAAIGKRQVARARTRPMATLEGYCLLMAATALLHSMSPQDFDKARQMLEHLIERDPLHPTPRAWLAKWHVMRVQQGWSDDIRSDTLHARDHCRRALDCDPRCALSLAIDGFVRSNLLKDLDGAEASHRQALAANPNEPLAWLLLGTVNAFRGRGDEARSETQRALELSPLDPSRYFFESLAATAALSAGDYGSALALAQSSLRLNRFHTSTLRAMAIAQVHTGQMDAARTTVQALLALEPHLTIQHYLARSPSSDYATGRLWSDALAAAGVPLQ